MNTVVTLTRQIGTLFDIGAVGAMPDRSLIDHFARGGGHSEAAFATLVERHGPMVLQVCRHVLADGHLAEDAFQVTFLLLARRARSIHDPDKLAAWLHRVARRVALRARAGIRRRHDREAARPGEIAVSADNPLERREIYSIVHEEIDRLTDAQRLPILLCALQGLSHEEAAERLRWPVGTVKSRLVRARRRLQGRLARRGLAPAITIAAIIADSPAPAASVPLALAMATTRAALQTLPAATTTTASISTSIAMLLQSELRAMLLAKMWLAAGGALAGAIAILIAITLAGPLNGSAQQIVLVADGSAPLAGGASIMPGSAPENPPAIRGLGQDKSVIAGPDARASALDEPVEAAIRLGVHFLKSHQQPDGSWPDIDQDAQTGMTSLATLALVAAGEKPDSPAIRLALEFLRKFGTSDLRSTYAISLQTMVFAAVEPARDQLRIAANVSWLERAQIKPGDPHRRPGDSHPWPGSWTYSDVNSGRTGDNSNTQYALLGLQAANEAGVPVRPDVWQSARRYWELAQQRDGSWTYTPDARASSASMTCAGISSLITARRESTQRRERLGGNVIHDCGVAVADTHVQKGTEWLASHFRVDENFGSGKQWKYYYLYGLERAGRLAGVRFFGEHDWYRAGAELLLREQDKLSGSWNGVLVEGNKVLSTSFALLFLAKGRAPVLINKLRHGPADDWDNDPDDVRNLVGEISHDWKRILNWQIVDAKVATVDDLLRAPILFINGHKAPELAPAEKHVLRAYVERGGSIVAEACCGSADFDLGFRALMKEIYPGDESQLRPLPEDHPLWRAEFKLGPEIHPLWGVRRGGRTAIIYSPKDLSCYWNQSGHLPANPAVMKARWVGKNIINYLTGREIPAAKPAPPEVPVSKRDLPVRNALRVARLKHAGDWNVAPKAIPNLMDALRKPPFRFDVTVTQKEMFPRDPNLIYYPLLYMSGRAAFAYARGDLEALRRHLDPGGGTIFGDAAGGNAAFDASFRRFVADLLPKHPLVAIPHDDPIYREAVGFDLKDVEYTKAAGGGRGFPQLEGAKLKDHWAVIYSKFDVGSALEGHLDADCKGYTRESAQKIAGNVLIYSCLP
jgi:RNA polymerase sigma factor (sigma-70 family)